MDIYELEHATGVVVSVGGQLPQNIALRLQEAGGGMSTPNPLQTLQGHRASSPYVPCPMFFRVHCFTDLV